MSLIRFLVGIFSIAFGIALAQTNPIPFRKIQINPQFYSEGIHFGDLNKDGIEDIISGPYWYPGPTFTQKFAFRTPQATPFDTTGDSDCYSVFTYDFNGDGWLDILSLRKPGGAELMLYENPGGGAALWAEHSVFSQVENESARLVDMDGDGKPEMITNSGGYGGWAYPDWNHPTSMWSFKKVTTKGNWGAYTHAIGAGDVDGDGRQDLLFATGWWGQPANIIDTPWVRHDAAFWGQANLGEGAGGAQMFTYDVDGDGDNDIVTSLQAHGWGLAWFENQNQGKTFVQHMIMGSDTEKAKYGIAFSQLHALALADMDGDGLKDIITGKRKGAHGHGLGGDVDSAAVLYWFRLTRTGGTVHFQPYLIDSVAGVGTQLIVADINKDGAPDILTSRRSGAYVFMNQRPTLSLLNSKKNSRHPVKATDNFLPSPWHRHYWDRLGRWLLP